MAVNKLSEIFPEKESPIRRDSREEEIIPSRLFQHGELSHSLETADTVDRETLASTLNYINFMDGHVLVLLQHPKYQESILVRASPGPCLGKELTCRWSDENLSGLELEAYQPLHLVIDDGLSVILVPAILEEINRNCLIIQLPTTSYVCGKRQARRYDCHGINVELSQKGFLASGELLDFSPVGFRIRVSPESSHSFHWLNSDELVNIHLRRNQQTLFSGPCKCIREKGNLLDKEIVLAPAYENIKRFKKRPIRSPRLQLAPSPILYFEHPFLGKNVKLDVSDISYSGFSVYENADEGILMPGMLIPELLIGLAGVSNMKCPAQVIYRQEENEKGVRCGLAILDMDFRTYSRLAHIICNAMDPHYHVSCNVDTDDLWELFFSAGFIYPMKYRNIQSYREDLRKNYQRFYQDNVEVGGNFTYQKNGRIYGHMSMLRAYEHTLLLQHHAGRAMNGLRHIGIKVLEQTSYYIHDVYRLHSAKVDYVMCYFRPDNVFPNMVFGDFAGALKNPQGCSLDRFAYLPYLKPSRVSRLPEGWLLQKTSRLDLLELTRFYRFHSGGLLLDAFGLEQMDMGSESLEEIYRRDGCKRRFTLYSLTRDGDLIAVLIANQSDLGLNLSEFLNGIKILMTKEAVNWEILSSAIAQLSPTYNINKVPIMIYPFEYVEASGIPYEKQYLLWILNLGYGNEYFEFMRRKFGFGHE
jgi:hypothetical protein